MGGLNSCSPVVKADLQYTIDDESIISENSDNDLVAIKEGFSTITVNYKGWVGGRFNFSHEIEVVSEDAVVIPDKYLEREFRKVIRKPRGDIYPSELENLKSFSPSSCFIKSFEGIQYASNLESFVFNGGCNMNKVSNISPLATLTKLTNLELRSHDIVDISPLQDLTNLTNLELSFNKISDISPLKKLTNLENLNLNRNDITGVSLLQNLTKLTNLEVKDNYIDIAPGSSDRLIIDAILGRGATVNYSTQNHIEDGFADKFKLTQGKVAPPILEKCIQNSNGGVEFMFTCSKSGFTIYYR